MNRQWGLGLSELLISLFLASIIMTTLIHVYIATKRHYLEMQKILERRFELQWVSDLLSDSIRRAGFTPCMGIERLKSLDMRHSGERLWGVKTDNQSHPFIQINKMSEVFAEEVSFLSPTELVTASPVVFNAHRPLMIADCQHAEVHQILNVEPYNSGQKITLVKAKMYPYESVVYVGEWVEERWFIKSNAHHRNTLHYQSTQSEELSPFIHSLSTIQYQIHDKTILKITLGLEQEKTHELTVAVRGS
ncbi:PilW family protein [Legionella worsleiensis]|uniref:Tfp pilus assembly protein PilW n=1 Tax=Legionella worsleiensis TaxID=45076 RepID=A0A0W1AIY3_9GAMM|nr:hypothetical protein [Legionella worsleiensis]KTD81327.1 hypothetical protein Lwor_0828 [Legionella worsleiensis]STY30753.1 Tfp pilus assembly protein PilW [Legionella worsleiensis]